MSNVTPRSLYDEITWFWLEFEVLMVEEIVRSGTKVWYKSAAEKKRSGYEAESEEFEDWMR